MAKQYYSVLTDYGTQMIASAIARKQPLQITQMAVGDGNGRATTPNSRNTGLVREVHRADISAISVDPRNDKQIIFELTIPENVGGFWIREMGIFDNQNRLVAYANCPDSFKPELTSGSGKVQVVRMILLVSSSDAITLKVDDSVIFATRGQLTPKTITATSQNAVDESGHSHEIDKASTSQAGIVTLDSSIDSEAENKAATPKAVKTAYDKAKAADDNANTRVSKSGGEMTGGLKLKANYGTSEKKWDYSGFYAGSATLNNETLPYFQIHIGSYGGNTAGYAKSLGFNLTDYKAYVMNWNSEGEYAGKKEILTELHRSDSVTSTSSDTVATSKAVKTAYDKAVDGVNNANAAQTAANNAQTTANAAIPSSKKSDSVTSASSDTVATSKAVKDAYDKAVDGVNKANAAQTTANNANNNANKRVLDSVKVSNLNTLSGSQVFFCNSSPIGTPPWIGKIDFNGIHIDSGLQRFQLASIDYNDLRYRFNDDNSGVVGAGEWSHWRRIAMIEDFTQNLATTGWCRLPNGLLLQWGAGRGAGKKQFPVAFRQVYQVVSSSTCGGDANYDLDLFFNNTHVWGRYQTNIRYFAIGK
ncbi:phage tail protein [Gallibacterium anatis]|uniref:phage tail-collar fiber domain-containing protein n=1 Tax=Gallibacterium anatis TaxID=750 RepID=UPI0009B87768|nr:phage tail protein [Gallibacterium anatis]